MDGAGAAEGDFQADGAGALPQGGPLPETGAVAEGDSGARWKHGW